MSLRLKLQSWWTFIVIERFGLHRDTAVARVTPEDRSLRLRAIRESHECQVALRLLDSEVDVLRRNR